MSSPPGAAGEAGHEPAAVYVEPARSYRTTYALLALLVAGMIADLALGGPVIHVVGWLLAIVIVVGIVAMATRTVRRLRSIVVTDTEVRVGTATLARSSIVAVDRDLDRITPVLGQQLHEGLPRGVRGLAAHLADGAVIAIPTRHPTELAAVLLPPAPGAPGTRDPSRSEADADWSVRPAEPADLPELADIDQRAATLFRVAGIDLPAVPFPNDTLLDAEAIFVAGRPPIGFARVDRVDGLAHLEDLAVVPSAMRHGVGSALLEQCCAWAGGHGYRAITLITFADVPWNGPFYQRRGFRPLAELTAGLAERRDRERSAGLDAAGSRVAMVREL